MPHTNPSSTWATKETSLNIGEIPDSLKLAFYLETENKKKFASTATMKKRPEQTGEDGREGATL